MFTNVVGAFVTVIVVPEIIPTHEKSNIHRRVFDNDNVPGNWEENVMILPHDKAVLTMQVVRL